MRVTQRLMVDNAIRSMSENMEKLGNLQGKAASGKRFAQASDDPKAAHAALSLRSSLVTTQSYLETALNVGEWMSATEVAFSQIVDLATKAINISLEGVSDSQNEARPGLAVQIDGFLTNAIEIGNTKFQGNYIFSGYKTTTQPFALLAGSPDSVTYSGDNGIIKRDLGVEQSMTVNIDGDTTFSPLYSAMIAARDALNADDLPALQTAIDNLNIALETIKEQRSYNGARQRQVQTLTSNLEQTELSIQGWLSNKENANLVEVITELRHQETIYQAALEVGHRTLATLNLFDLMS